MNITKIITFRGLFAALPLGTSLALAAAPAALSQAGGQLQAKYESELAALKAEITKAVPVPDERGRAALLQATETTKKAQAAFDAAQQDAGKVSAAKGLVEHAKGKWIGGAEKGIAAAEAALKAAKTEAEREKANKDLAHWQANKQDGLKALAERQAALDKAKVDEAKFATTQAAAKAALQHQTCVEFTELFCTDPMLRPQ